MITLNRSRIRKLLQLLILVMLFLGCSQKKDFEKEKEEIVAKQMALIPKEEVDVIILDKKPFTEEIIANGKLIANKKSVLKFSVGGTVEKIYVQNGDKVSKGQRLASLDHFKYQQALQMAEIALKKASLEFEDMLVGRGYDLENQDSIPKEIYEMASVRSGYKDALFQKENSQYDVNATVLRAPFSGTVADIEYNAFEQVTEGSDFLTLIDDSYFEVAFNIIESEVDLIKLNQNVEVEAFHDGQTYQGKIKSINPVVDENGTVAVRAKIKNTGQLLEGMNVKVRIKREFPDSLSVPKSALMSRQEQEVVFKYKNGKTFWTYVHSTHENSSHYAIIPNPDKNSAELTKGDTIIVSGNLNLAHGTEVALKNVLPD